MAIYPNDNTRANGVVVAVGSRTHAIFKTQFVIKISVFNYWSVANCENDVWATVIPPINLSYPVALLELIANGPFILIIALELMGC